MSYKTGYKFHYTTGQLADWKDKMNNLHISLGLKAAPKKGYTYDGKKRDEITANNRNTYEVMKKAMKNEKESYILNCAICVLNNSKESKSKEDFIAKMEFDGFKTDWNDNHKNIVFWDIQRMKKREKKYKVRLSRLFDMFNEPIFQKEKLLNEFERNCRGKEIRKSQLQIRPDSTATQTSRRINELPDEKSDHKRIHKPIIKSDKNEPRRMPSTTFEIGKGTTPLTNNKPKKGSGFGHSR